MRIVLNNPASPLHGHLEVFVADNGQSLDRERLSSDKIHIIRTATWVGQVVLPEI